MLRLFKSPSQFSQFTKHGVISRHVSLFQSLSQSSYKRRTTLSNAHSSHLYFSSSSFSTPPPPSNPNPLLQHAPGLMAAATVMSTGFLGADYLGAMLLSLQGISDGTSAVSGIPVSILLGMAIRNTIGISDTFTSGLKFATTNILRGGIICVGAKLSALEMVALGASGVPVVMLSIGVGIGVVTWLGPKVGISRKMTALIAAGSSICGGIDIYTNMY